MGEIKKKKKKKEGLPGNCLIVENSFLGLFRSIKLYV